MDIAISEITPALTRIEQQTIDHLDVTPTTDTTTLASHLAFKLWHQGDEFADWHTKTQIKPMLRALFVRELLRCRQPDSAYTKTDHERRIRQPGVADQLGFDLGEDEQAPCRTTYDQAWTNRLSDEHRQRLAHAATRVHDNGIPLGQDTLNGEIADKSDTSQSTKNRAIHRTTRQILTQVTDLIFPLVDY